MVLICLEVVPVGQVDNMAELTDILCCRIGSLPMNYLAMPSGASFKAIIVWIPIMEKIKCF